MVGSGMNLITTVIGFGMSATFIVFVCTRIICGRLRRSESRPMFEIESRIDLEQPEHHTSGLEPVLVAAIPTMKFNQEAFSTIDDTQCSICLGEYQEKEVLRIMPKCGHNFHLACIDVWLRKQSTCPVCRLPLQESLGTKHARPVMFSRAQSLEGSEITNEHSQQWLLPGNERSIVNSNNNNNNQNTNTNNNNNNNERSIEEESVPGIHSETTTSGESETSQTRQQ